MSEISVSVIMVTYGHENYIRQAVESVLNQECRFKVDLIIANDCSPDNTDIIIRKIINEHPRGSWINYKCQDTNIGVQKNFKYAIAQAKGKYIAICDGDDYWNDRYKLEKQVIFLENNPEFVLHSSNAYWVDGSNTTDNLFHSNSRDLILEVNDLVLQNQIITCTCVFRNVQLNFPVNLDDFIFLDWMSYIILLVSTKSKAYKSTEVLSSYRILQTGIMKSLDQVKDIEAHIRQITWNFGKVGSPKQLYLKKLNQLYYKKFQLLVGRNLRYKAVICIFHSLKSVGLKLTVRQYLGYFKSKF